MAIERTSKAEIYSARLNPIHPTEGRALQIIKKLESEGFNFKKIVVDAILRADGVAPEMFTRDAEAERIADTTQRLVKEALGEFLQRLQQSGFTVIQGAEANRTPDEHLDAFSKNFANSFLQRQQSSVGAYEDED